MQQHLYPTLSEAEKILKRPAADYSSLHETASAVFEKVKNEGDAALVHFTNLFDKVQLNKFLVNQETIGASANLLSEDLKSAIKIAADNISRFHTSQILKEEKIETSAGVVCWRESRAIERVGLYVPGGTAPLFSSVLMLGIPAMIAGCKEVILCSPPSFHGSIHPAILYAANLCGIRQVFSIGGVQAIAAMTFGTESIPAVYKIFGPGNAFVTVAKQLAQQHGVAIDMPAGPSEVMVLADESANAAFVAADLLSQAEHGSDSQVVLVTNEKKLLHAVADELQKQLPLLPRKDIAEKALQNSKAILVNNIAEAVAIANLYAAEHLILAVENAEDLLPEIQNAGSIFLGHHTPESCGDYASGTNHTLPTNGFARAYSGVSLDSFMKKITVQKITPDGLKNLGAAVIAMAENEQLQAHAEAVRVRLENLFYIRQS